MGTVITANFSPAAKGMRALKKVLGQKFDAIKGLPGAAARNVNAETLIGGGLTAAAMPWGDLVNYDPEHDLEKDDLLARAMLSGAGGGLLGAGLDRRPLYNPKWIGKDLRMRNAGIGAGAGMAAAALGDSLMKVLGLQD